MISQSDEPKPRYGIASLERRKHKRYLVNLPVEYYRVGSSIASSGVSFSQERMTDLDQEGKVFYQAKIK